MLDQEPVPALLRATFDREAEARRAILRRPVDHAGEARGHLRLESDCVGIDIDAVRRPEIKDRIVFWKRRSPE